jgi:zinc and cadmium transporter
MWIVKLVDLKLIYIISFGFLGGMVGVLLASFLLLFSEKSRKLITMELFSFAIGTLLGVTFTDLLPNAVEHKSIFTIFLTFIIGIIFFYLLGMILTPNYDQSAEKNNEENPGLIKHIPDQKVGKIILIGASLHNFIDGIIITASFIESIPMGIIVTLSIIAHEIPHEISDFVILLESGFSRKKALIYNIITGFSTLLGSILSYIFLIQLEKLTPFIMTLAASSFIYITVSELVPKLKKTTGMAQTIQQAALVLIGICTISLLEFLHPG